MSRGRSSALGSAVSAAYTWGGRDYTVSTGLLWREPQRGGRRSCVWRVTRTGRGSAPLLDPDSAHGLDLYLVL